MTNHMSKNQLRFKSWMLIDSSYSPNNNNGDSSDLPDMNCVCSTFSMLTGNVQIFVVSDLHDDLHVATGKHIKHVNLKQTTY